MDVAKIKELMGAFSKNGLTEFSYQDKDVSLKMKKEEPAGTRVEYVVDGPMPPRQPGPPPCGPGPMPGHGPGPEDRGPGGRPPVQESYSPAGETSETTDEQEPEGNAVTCPLVGTFYSAASPDDEPFVQVGDTVKKGQVLCIVEAMKLMNEIESDYSGVVKAILVKNGDLVEYGQKLFIIG